MSDWNRLGEEWQQRARRLFQRSVNETNITKSQHLWDIASNSESNRLEWLYESLKEEESLLQPPQPIYP